MSRREQRGDYRSPAWTGGEWLAARLKLLDPDRAGRRAGAQTVPPLQIDRAIDLALLTAASRWPTLAKIAPSCLTHVMFGPWRAAALCSMGAPTPYGSLAQITNHHVMPVGASCAKSQAYTPRIG